MSEAVDRLIMAWSGGKDSALALGALLAGSPGCVECLLTSVTSGYDRVSIHGVRRALLRQQAHALGLPLEEAEIPREASNESYEAAMAGALARLHTRFPRARAVAFGDLFLEDVRRYRERQFAALGRPLSFPLWGHDTRELAHAFVARGFRAVLVCVDTTQLAADFAGRAFDHDLLAELPATVDPCGERGEFHTFVADGPIFRHPVAYRKGDVVLRENRFAYCDLVPEEEPDAPA